MAIAPVHYGAFEKDGGKFGFIKQDAERSNIFVLPWGCIGFQGAFPPIGTRVAYEVVTDAKTGKPRADNVRPEDGGDVQENSAWPAVDEPQVEHRTEERQDQSDDYEGAPTDNRTGTFKKNTGKWGFIGQDCGEPDLFVLPFSCPDSNLPEEGTRVRYDVVQDARTGRPRGHNVQVESSPEAVHVKPDNVSVQGSETSQQCAKNDCRWCAKGECWGRGQKGGGKGGKSEGKGKGGKAGGYSYQNTQNERSNEVAEVATAEVATVQAAWMQDADSLEPLSRTLASILRHRAGTVGIHVRADGFASLKEVLSNSALFRSNEAVCPGSVDVIKTRKEVPVELIEAVRTIVSTSLNNEKPRFEIWEDESTGTPDIFIRATHKHSIAHVWKEEAADEIDSNSQARVRQQTQNEIAEEPTTTVKTQVIGLSRPALVADGQKWPEWSTLLGDDRDPRRRPNQKTEANSSVEVFAISTPPRQRPNSDEQSKAINSIAFQGIDALYESDPWGGCKTWGAEAKPKPGIVTNTAPAQADVVLPPVKAEPIIASTLPSHLSKNTGKIRSFNPEKGFGFIVCESVQGDVFLNALSIIGEHPPKVIGYPNNPAMGPEMRFDIEIRNGKPRATNASLVTEASTETTQTPQKSEASESLSDSLMASRIEEEHGEYEDMLPQDILKMLPKDAPDCVWKYLKQLEALAKA